MVHCICLLPYDLGGGVLELVAKGSLHSVNPARVIVKKIVLTGFPYRVNRRFGMLRLCSFRLCVFVFVFLSFSVLLCLSFFVLRFQLAYH